MVRHYQEDWESKSLWQRAQLNPVTREHLYHIPNGGKRNKNEAARMKGMGVRAGVHDYHLPVRRGAYIGLWVELKVGKNKATEGQKEWKEKMIKQGHAAYIAYGWEEAWAVIDWYLSLPEPDEVVPELPSIKMIYAISE